MKYSELRKSVGLVCSLSPCPIFEAEDGRRLPHREDKWILEAVGARGSDVTFRNQTTGQAVLVGQDYLREYLGGYWVLKGQVILGPNGPRIEPSTNVRALSKPLPLIRYQETRSRIVAQSIPTVFEMCSGCGAGVRFRTLVRLQLLGGPADHFPAEQFCPECAARRGSPVTMDEGVTVAELLAHDNPTYRSHVVRLLKTRVFKVLTADERLRAEGVTNVGAGIGGGSFTLIAEVASGGSRQSEVTFAEMEAKALLNEIEIAQYLRSLLLVA